MIERTCTSCNEPSPLVRFKIRATGQYVDTCATCRHHPTHHYATGPQFELEGRRVIEISTGLFLIGSRKFQSYPWKRRGRDLKEELEKDLAAYAAGMNQAKLGKLRGVCASTIYSVMLALGKTRPRGGRQKSRKSRPRARRKEICQRKFRV